MPTIFRFLSEILAVFPADWNPTSLANWKQIARRLANGKFSVNFTQITTAWVTTVLYEANGYTCVQANRSGSILKFIKNHSFEAIYV